jgi:hypothetical protein
MTMGSVSSRNAFGRRRSAPALWAPDVLKAEASVVRDSSPVPIVEREAWVGISIHEG